MVSTPGGELVKAYGKKAPLDKSRINSRIRIFNHLIAVSEMEKEGIQLPGVRKRGSSLTSAQSSSEASNIDGFSSPGIYNSWLYSLTLDLPPQPRTPPLIPLTPPPITLP